MDKNGKLFGKINIIDLLVIIIAVAVVAAVALKMTGRMGAARPEVGANIVYTVRVEGVDKEVYAAIEEFQAEAKANGFAGDRLMSNGELLNAYVTDMTAVPHDAKAKISSMDGDVIIPVLEDTLDVTFTVEGFVTNNVKTELGSQEVRVGKTHIVKTTHYELTGGVILTCQWKEGTGADNAART